MQTPFTQDCPSAVPRCSGKLQVNMTGTEYDICGPMNDVIAQQACWETGVNLEKGRKIRLSTYVSHADFS